MANQVIGKAKFTYATTYGGNSTCALGTPLHALETRKTVRTYTAESLNGTVFSTVSIAGGRHELTGDIRFHDNARELVDLIEAGQRGYTLTYYHTSSASGHACTLIDATDVRIDRELAGKGYYETRLTVSTASTVGFSEVL